MSEQTIEKMDDIACKIADTLIHEGWTSMSIVQICKMIEVKVIELHYRETYDLVSIHPKIH